MFSAAVEFVDPQDISFGHVPSLADLHVGVGDGGDAVPSILGGEGCSAIVHDGGIVVGGVQVVGLLLVKVVGHARINVLPVDSDMPVTVAPGLLVLEAQSMVDLMLDDTVVEAALFAEREHLSASHLAQRGEASISVLNADEVSLTTIWRKANAGSGMERLHGVFNLPLVPAGERTAHCVGNRHIAVVALAPQAVVAPTGHGISGSGCYQVSLQQDLTGAVVGGQNPGADVNVVTLIVFHFHFCFFLHDRGGLGETQQQQQEEAERRTHLQGLWWLLGSGSGSSLDVCLVLEFLSRDSLKLDV